MRVTGTRRVRVSLQSRTHLEGAQILQRHAHQLGSRHAPAPAHRREELVLGVDAVHHHLYGLNALHGGARHGRGRDASALQRASLGRHKGLDEEGKEVEQLVVGALEAVRRGPVHVGEIALQALHEPGRGAAALELPQSRGHLARLRQHTLREPPRQRRHVLVRAGKVLAAALHDEEALHHRDKGLRRGHHLGAKANHGRARVGLAELVRAPGHRLHRGLRVEGSARGVGMGMELMRMVT